MALVDSIFTILLVLVGIFLVIFYQTKIRGIVEKVVWALVILIILISIIDLGTPGVDSFDLSGVITVFIVVGLAFVDLILVSIFIFGKLGEKMSRRTSK